MSLLLPPPKKMLFNAYQLNSRQRRYVLDCPHMNWSIDVDAVGSDRDAEMLGSMMTETRKRMLEALMSGKIEEACMCEPPTLGSARD